MKKASITSSERTGGQEKQLKRMLEDKVKSAVELALSKVNPDKEGTQRFLGAGNEFGENINDFMINQFQKLSTSNQFANEEVRSNHNYPKEYTGLRSIEDRIKSIAKIFDLDPTNALEYVKSLPALPNGAEGWFAFPSVDALASKYFPDVTDEAEKYCRAIQLILDKIAASRSFYNYREGEIDVEHLRNSIRTREAISKIAETQKGDILIVAAQLGLRYRGKSVRQAREIFVENEFGLDSLIVGSIVLTDPERLIRWEQLHMDCPGDEFSYEADGRFDYAPIFYFDDDKFGFNARKVGFAYGSCGSASGFLFVPLPQ